MLVKRSPGPRYHLAGVGGAGVPANTEGVVPANTPGGPGSGLPSLAGLAGPDPLGIGAALQGGLAGVLAGGQILLGGAMIAVAILILLAQTSAGGALARGVSSGTAKVGRKAIGAALGGPAGAAVA